MSDRVAGKVIMVSSGGRMGLAKLTDNLRTETYQFSFGDVLSGAPLKVGRDITFKSRV